MTYAQYQKLLENFDTLTRSQIKKLRNYENQLENEAARESLEEQEIEKQEEEEEIRFQDAVNAQDDRKMKKWNEYYNIH